MSRHSSKKPATEPGNDRRRRLPAAAAWVMGCKNFIGGPNAADFSTIGGDGTQFA
jgi:hypothetical protein